ncbi:hypothetical protein ACFWYW_58530 [Nonomuraea sp. NPDC059023]|uniref:hypothetical protein n=1 Tax=unclassified Nonomuraea TaxID=2593643 RepID=UPI0036895632
MNGWQNAIHPPTVGHMDLTGRDHHATITTPRGSKVVMPFLTEEEAADIAEQYGPPSELPQPQTAAKGDPCGQCGGAGGWETTVETKSKDGSVVITKKWVNCRPCGGTGTLK